MEIIIQDILELSMVTQLEVVSQKVNISDLASECIAELKQENPNREVHFYIEPNLKTQGDPGLLKILLKNVIGNAWKYTGKTANAQISIFNKNGKTFCVQDNGAGFDMAYYDQIFKPFKRLHSEEEFEGSGIGLSIVQKIVKKHHGNIYAISEIGKGSKFYFEI
jgi:light-regulated signal transduction histidine kinase (bacteriophytochrome)